MCHSSLVHQGVQVTFTCIPALVGTQGNKLSDMADNTLFELPLQTSSVPPSNLKRLKGVIMRQCNDT